MDIFLAKFGDLSDANLLVQAYPLEDIFHLFWSNTIEIFFLKKKFIFIYFFVSILLLFSCFDYSNQKNTWIFHISFFDNKS
jgi:hypothetical protein